MQPCAELSHFISDRAAQELAQRTMIAARETWRSGKDVAPVLEELDRYGAGAQLGDVRRLAALLVDARSARTFVDAFLEAMARAMRASPLGHPCFWHSLDGGYSAVHLAHSGRATLSLVVAEAGGGESRHAALSASFSATERHEAILAGEATGAVLAFDPSAGLERAAMTFTADQTLHLPAWTTRHFDEVAHPLACLRLSRRPVGTTTNLQVRLADGAVMHRAAGDPEATRHELMASLLGAMQRRDGAPALAAFARRDGGDAARWQAVRSALALDTARGFSLLAALSADPDDPLHGDALKLKTQLLARYPVLAQVEDA